MRFLVILYFISIAATASAQLNPSFETADAGWVKVQGTFNRHTVKFFNGALPLVPSNGNYFVSLENDTISTPRKAGIIRNNFAFTDTPASFYFDALYLPVTQPQNGRFTLFMSKWNGSQRDTILYYTDTIGPRFSGPGQIALQWNTYSYDLNAHYILKARPDSATLSFTNDDVITATGTAILHLDNISFGTFPVGLQKTTWQDHSFSVYPNPAADGFTVSWGEQEAEEISVFSIKGELLLTAHPGTHSVYLEPGLAPGLYVVRATFKNGNVQNHKIFISR